MTTKVKVKGMPELKLTHVRHQSPYKEMGKALDRLARWAGPRDFLNLAKTKKVGIYYDSQRVTDESKIQSSACVTIKEDVKVSAEIGKMTF